MTASRFGEVDVLKGDYKDVPGHEQPRFLKDSNVRETFTYLKFLQLIEASPKLQEKY